MASLSGAEKQRPNSTIRVEMAARRALTAGFPPAPQTLTIRALYSSCSAKAGTQRLPLA